MEPLEIELPENASDIRGMRFGKLQALFPHASTERGIEWVTRCDCGRIRIRAASDLLRAEREGVHCSCRVCSQEDCKLRAQAFSRERKSEVFRQRYETSNELWSVGDEIALEAEIREGMAEFLGFEPRHTEKMTAFRTDAEYDGTRSHSPEPGSYEDFNRR